jgi:hypothetical protein
MNIDEVVWQGQTYRRHPDHPSRSRRVYFMATSGPRDYLHRAIYRFHHGPIPAGWHVHHKDHDPLNNDPANLEAISPAAHAAHHSTRHPEIQVVCSGCGETFVGRRPWAKWCSSACKERTRRARGLTRRRERTGPFSESRECQECGTTYEAKRPWARFCTSRCKQRSMRSAA